MKSFESNQNGKNFYWANRRNKYSRRKLKSSL